MLPDNNEQLRHAAATLHATNNGTLVIEYLGPKRQPTGDHLTVFTPEVQRSVLLRIGGLLGLNEDDVLQQAQLPEGISYSLS